MSVPHQSARQIEATLKTIWCELLDVEPSTICRQSRFFDFGGDSMLLLSLQALLWTSFSVEFSTDVLVKLASFEDMKNALCQCQASTR